MSQEHAFEAAERFLKAQAAAQRIKQTEGPSRDTFVDQSGGRDGRRLSRPSRSRSDSSVEAGERSLIFCIAQALSERFRIAGCVAKTEATRARIKAASFDGGRGFRVRLQATLRSLPKSFGPQ